ncbi:MAG: hypothetical protein ACYDAR_10855 [Thermomicrobiales bacterium]
MPTLTPSGTFEGFQESVIQMTVGGWVWDRSNPDTPVRVEIYDGAALIARVTADMFRPDLRDAGKGDGRHGFLHRLPARLADGLPHTVTTRIAGTNITLCDPVSGGTPAPIHCTLPAPAVVPHFSLPPYARWGYYTLLRTLLRALPFPIWRLPAALLGSARMLLDADGRRLDRALLTALGTPATPRACWRMHWSRAYQRQADLLLTLQSRHITRRWVVKRVRCQGALPPGGAVLVTPHHANSRLGTLALATMVDRLGTIISEPLDPAEAARHDPTLVAHWRQTRLVRDRTHGNLVFTPREAGRKGLRLLRDGGYFVVSADTFIPTGRAVPLLGRVVRLPRGAAWFARQSGKPMLPCMVVPDRFGWRLWIGDEAPPTEAGVRACLEASIRQAPGSWARFVAMAWLDAPPVC